MIFLVNDANILIDLLKIDLLEAFFQLNYDFQVTDMVVAEITEDNVDELDVFFEKQRLVKQTFTFEELAQIQLLQVEHAGLSTPDCSCLYISQKFEATFLTGDSALRRVAEQKAIAVHGVLWIFDEMVANGLLSKSDAADKLEELMVLNQRLPQTECNKRLKTWRRLV